MYSLNQVTFSGNLGKDPKVEQGQKTRANFSVAVSVGKDKTVWANCTAWDKTAEFCQRLRQGDPVVVVGRMDGYKDNAGADRVTFVVSDIRVLHRQVKDPSHTHRDTVANQGKLQVEDEDIPF
jgi:single-stranded DNA-binding protein